MQFKFIPQAKCGRYRQARIVGFDELAVLGQMAVVRYIAQCVNEMVAVVRNGDQAMDKAPRDPLADLLAKRREAHRQRMLGELLERFKRGKGRAPISVEEIRDFIARERAADLNTEKGKR
jgi:hypothetical protein